MATVQKVFKSYDRYKTIPTSGFGLVKFVNHRLITNNQKLIDYVETVLIPDSALGIYVDEKEKEFTGSINPGDVRDDEIKNFLQDRERNTQLSDSNYTATAQVKASSSEDIRGVGQPAAQRFDKIDLAKVLAARRSGELAASHVTTAQDTEVAKDPVNTDDAKSQSQSQETETK